MTDRPPARFIVVEGSPFGRPSTHSFASEEALRAHVIARLRLLVAPAERERLERAIAEGVVSEDGVRATAEVIAGTVPYLRALAKAYAPTLVIAEKRPEAPEDA
ncbi:MAG: hypothetical protein NZ533_03795 [Casimicrobiaceae bacterium]|nr:hypothetical protein [Casimicrobiaceae bacterium]MCX8099053.1 hypothetical protein [Casimicrobiaceae bacterium]MDW8312582.1 hypothetical protein [Burkholderiales bacterium]